MKLKLSFPLLTLFLLIFSQPSIARTEPEVLARKALSTDPAESAPAIEELRSSGPAGLSILFQVYDDEIKREINNPPAANPDWSRLSKVLDRVSQQKDSYLSGLYWYTDFAKAQDAARATNKPILSLRLLGKLSEEFSCANSRFFRTVLYSNQEVSKALRERFVLHWESVRPAPRITIDFGDGRKLERTVTGNSIHYILDAEGRPIDALPGLYGPQAFLRSLMDIEAFYRESAREDTNKLVVNLVAYHRNRLNAINLDWFSDTQRIGGKIPQGVTVRKVNGTPQALEIASLAVTKAITEASILRSMTAGSEALGGVTDEAAWKKIANSHLADAQLDARSISLIKRQTQRVFEVDGSDLDSAKGFTKLVQALQLNIALDTVRNEYLLHTKLHAWLALDKSHDLQKLNERVYAELFLTPSSDPWLGLFSAETYTALENGGIVR